PSSPTASGPSPVALDANGRRLLCVSAVPPSTSSISSWLVGKDGTLTAAPNSPVTATAGAFSVHADPKGRFVFDAAEGTSIGVYAFDAKTAAVTALPDSPVETGLAATYHN